MTLAVGTNSYVDVDDATTYFEDSLRFDGWDSLDSDTKSRALITATRMLDRQTWSGEKTSSDQDLQWPRANVTDKYGNDVASDAVPQAIIDATCELALQLTSDPDAETNKNTTANVKFAKAGEASVSFFRQTPGGRFPTIIQELIGQFLNAGGTGGLSAPTVSGNCGTSQFDCNPYGLREGF